jgi:NSS family neurotransmitter:Na+ symporter
MPLGGLVSVTFFVLLSIAALTSSISLLEVVVSYFVDERAWSRRKSVAIIGAITFVMAIPSALSQGAVPSLTAGGVFGPDFGFLGFMDYYVGNLGLAIGAFFLSIFIGWVWGADEAAQEMMQGSNLSAQLLSIWMFLIRYVIPIVVFVIILGYVTGTL